MNDRTENIPADTVAIMEYVDDGFGGKKSSITFSTIEELQKQHHIIINKEGDGFSILPGSVIFVPYGYHIDENGSRYPRYLKLVAEKEYIFKPKDE